MVEPNGCMAPCWCIECKWKSTKFQVRQANNLPTVRNIDSATQWCTIHSSVYRAVQILISTFRPSDDLWHYRKQVWWIRHYIPIVIYRTRSPTTLMHICTSPTIHWLQNFYTLILSIRVTTSNMIRICHIYIYTGQIYSDSDWMSRESSDGMIHLPPDVVWWLKPFLRVDYLHSRHEYMFLILPAKIQQCTSQITGTSNALGCWQYLYLHEMPLPQTSCHMVNYVYMSDLDPNDVQ